LGPCDQVLGDQGEFEPHGVEVELAEREVLKPGLFRAADPVLGVTGFCPIFCVRSGSD
jgi:hypothetical protein